MLLNKRSLRIVRAIAAKDILEAIKNKSTLTVVISALFVVIVYRLIPGLTGGATPLELNIYDAAAGLHGVPGQFSQRLEASRALDVMVSSTPEEMLGRLSRSEAPALGLTVPEGFDQTLAQGTPPVLEAFTLYWASDEELAKVRQAVEAELASVAGEKVSLAPQIERIYPAANQNTLGAWAGFSLVFAILMVGLQLIPNLMLEERQSHTLAALLVSPAGPAEIVAGKSIAALVYGLLAGAVVMVAYSRYILTFWPLVLATVAGSLFFIALGLLVGMKVETRGQLGMFVGVMILPLFIPVVLTYMDDLLPPWLLKFLGLLPSVAMFRLAQAGFGLSPVVNDVLASSTVLLFWIGLTMGLVVWQVSRMDRAGGTALSWIGMRIAMKRGGADQAAGVTTSPVPAKPGLPRTPANGQAPPPARYSLPSPGIYHPTGLKIVSAIGLKDLREAFHNKIILTIVLGVLVMILLNGLLPLLLSSVGMPTIIVYDPGNSQVLRTLAAQPGSKMALVRSQADFERYLVQLPNRTAIGLVIPADFDSLARSGAPVELLAYRAHWATPGANEQLSSDFAAKLSQASGARVNILADDPLASLKVYPTTQGFGQPLMIAQILTVALLIVGVVLTPMLLVEEKENHTLEALLLSPATTPQIILAKALVGFLFVALASVVVLAFSGRFFVHWEIFLLALLAGSLFAMTSGLVVGAVSNNPTTLGLWSGMLLLFLLLSGLLLEFDSPALPGWLRSVLPWLPGGAIFRLFGLSMMGSPSLAEVWRYSGLLFGVAAALALLAIWKFKKL